MNGIWPCFHVTNLRSSFSPGPSHPSLSPPPLWFLNEALENLFFKKESILYMQQKQYIYHRGSVHIQLIIDCYSYSVQPF